MTSRVDRLDKSQGDECCRRASWKHTSNGSKSRHDKEYSWLFSSEHLALSTEDTRFSRTRERTNGANGAKFARTSIREGIQRPGGLADPAPILDQH